MARLAAKLLVLLAVLLMPLGMTGATAAAAEHHSAVSMPMQHCPEQGSQKDANGGFVECTMACSAALPALDVRPDQPLTMVCIPDAPGLAQRLHGLHPETATPPPKRS